MNRFLDLTHRRHDPDDPYAADKLLPDCVRNSPFRLWSPGDPIPQRGVFVLLGIATWSGYDTQLLDMLQEAIANRNGFPPVALFNAGILTSIEAFERYIPGLPPPTQMPVVGVWRDGQLVDRAVGRFACDLVAHMFDFTGEDVVAALDQARAARARS
jgi:hypothetical protein